MILQTQSSEYASLKDIAAAVQSFAVALAALFGGIWALYTFRARRDRDKAQSELLDLQRKLRFQAKIDSSLTITPLYKKEEIYLLIEVTLKNHGNRDIRINFSDNTLVVANLTVSQDSAFEVASLHYSPVIGYLDLHKKKLEDCGYLILEAEATQLIPFLICLQKAGLYFVSFQADITEPEAVFAIEAGGDTKDLFLSARQFALIEPDNSNTSSANKA
jgi:hypothetical protein